MHPFLDTKSLSDEELLDRLNKAHTYLHAQTRLGHTPTVQSIKEVISALEDERKTRTQRVIDEESKRKNVTGSNTIELGKLEE